MSVTLPPFVERYIERHQWGADPSNVIVGHPIPERQVVGLVLHHTVMPLLPGESIEAYMRRLQKVRPDLGAEVPYSVGVFPGSNRQTCVIAVGRGKGRTGAHTAGLNSTRYGVFVPGDTDRQGLTPGQIAGIRWLGATWLRDPINAAPTIGHQQAPPYWSNGTNLNNSGCPGDTGMAAMPLIQPPFLAPAPAATTTPRRHGTMVKLTNTDGRIEYFDIRPDGHVVGRWQGSDKAALGPWTPIQPGNQPPAASLLGETAPDGRLCLTISDTTYGELFGTWQAAPGIGMVEWFNVNELLEYLAG